MATDVSGLERTIRAHADRVLDRTVKRLCAELDARVPVDTGRLKRSRRVRIARFGNRHYATIEYPVDYAQYTDTGNDPGGGRIYGNPLLAFRWHGELVIVRSVRAYKGSRWWSKVMNERHIRSVMRSAARGG